MRKAILGAQVAQATCEEAFYPEVWQESGTVLPCPVRDSRPEFMMSSPQLDALAALLAWREAQLAAQQALTQQRKVAAAEKAQRKASESRSKEVELQRKAVANIAARAALISAAASTAAAGASARAAACAEAAGEARQACRVRERAATTLQGVARSRAARAERRRRQAEADARRPPTLSCRDGQIEVNERQLEYFEGLKLPQAISMREGAACPPRAAFAFGTVTSAPPL